MNKEERLDTLARDVLKLSRNTLLVNLRFLDAALNRFILTPYPGTLATDGQYLAYNARHVLQCYRAEKESSARDYLHMVFHCVFRHMYVHTLVDRPCWDLACDVAVENAVTQLGLKATESARQRQQTEELDGLRDELKQLTAERLYRYYLDKNLPPAELERLQALFRADEHTLWYMPPTERASFPATSAGGAVNAGEDRADAPADGGPSDGVPANGGPSGDAPARAGGLSAEMEAVWTAISRRMQIDLEAFSGNRGGQTGALTQNLNAVNRERYDYTAFLRKFAVRDEVMRVNDDEFDYIFYTYGLKRYKNMPLIEPLEYREIRRIREFVIAIDTSGSVSGDLVQKFVQKTYNVMKSTESFFSRINVHIIQCDEEIQEDAKITCQEEFDEYLRTMQIRGLGNTDFRPVFSYVEKLRKAGEFCDLKGLIYFTDGFGTFPAKKPDYDAAFVFLEDGDNIPKVPPWAIRLVLEQDEI